MESLVGRPDGFGFDSEGDGSLERMVNRVSPQNLHGVLWPLSGEQTVSRGGSREIRRGQPDGIGGGMERKRVCVGRRVIRARKHVVLVNV